MLRTGLKLAAALAGVLVVLLVGSVITASVFAASAMAVVVLNL